MATTPKKPVKKQTGGKRVVKAQNNTPVRREWGGAVFFFLAVFLVLDLFSVEAWFIQTFSDTLKGLLGLGYWLVPPIFVLCSYLLFFHQGKPVAQRVGSALVIPFTMSCLCQGMTTASARLPWNDVTGLWSEGLLVKGSGLVGGMVGALSTSLFSGIGTVMIFTVLTLFFAMGAANLTIMDIIDWYAARPAYEPKEKPTPREKKSFAFPKFKKDKFSEFSEFEEFDEPREEVPKRVKKEKAEDVPKTKKRPPEPEIKIRKVPKAKRPELPPLRPLEPHLEHAPSGDDPVPVVKPSKKSFDLPFLKEKQEEIPAFVPNPQEEEEKIQRDPLLPPEPVQVRSVFEPVDTNVFKPTENVKIPPSALDLPNALGDVPLFTQTMEEPEAESLLEPLKGTAFGFFNKKKAVTSPDELFQPGQSDSVVPPLKTVPLEPAQAEPWETPEPLMELPLAELDFPEDTSSMANDISQEVMKRIAEEEEKRRKEEEELRAKERAELEELRELREREARRIREEEMARREQEENSRRLEEENSRRLQEEENSRRLQEEENYRRLQEEENSRRLQEEENSRRLEEENSRRLEEENSHRLQEEENSRRLQEEENSPRQEEENSGRLEEENSRRLEEENSRRLQEEENSRRLQEENSRRLQEEEKSGRQEEEENSRRLQEEEDSRRLEEEEKSGRQEEDENSRRLQEEENSRRLQEEENSRRLQEEENSRRQEEENSRRLQEEENSRRLQEEENSRRQEEIPVAVATSYPEEKTGISSTQLEISSEPEEEQVTRKPLSSFDLVISDDPTLLPQEMSQASRDTGFVMPSYKEEEAPPPPVGYNYPGKDVSGAYKYPPISLLKPPSSSNVAEQQNELQENLQRLDATLQSFKIKATMKDVIQGPSVTRYEVELSQGEKLSKLVNLSDDIALALGATGVRIAPITDKISTVGIEVPNKAVAPVEISQVIDSPQFSNSDSKVSFAVGKDITGQAVVGNISKMPHLLVAGTTGAGKSVCTNALIISLLYKASPEEVRLIMVDPKMVELGIYNGIPHLLIPVVTDPKKAAGALQWAVFEMMKRYKLFADAGTRDLASYNKLAETRDDMEKMPQVVVIIDELADLMLVAAKEVEESICRVAQMGRASGMHLIIATQRPSADVITGLMKANIPSRIAFAVSSGMDSRIILDVTGAEKLVGRGDMLYAPLGEGKPTRVQGCLITDSEVAAVVDFVKRESGTASYSEEIMEQIDQNVAAKEKGNNKDKNQAPPDLSSEDQDEMLYPAIDMILDSKQVSVSFLQRKLKLGYARAARIVDSIEELGIIGASEGGKGRPILISKEQWQEMKYRQGQAGENNSQGEEIPWTSDSGEEIL